MFVFNCLLQKLREKDVPFNGVNDQLHILPLLLLLYWQFEVLVSNSEFDKNINYAVMASNKPSETVCTLPIIKCSVVHSV